MGFDVEEYVKISGMESSSTLFEKVVPVRVTKCNSEDRHMDLTARFIMGLSKVHRTTKVNEDDFQSLKVEQCILVDFSTFPYKFIELLEQCIVSGNSDNPRFLAILHVRTGDSTFTVVETNQFKHLSHLALVFRQGNDAVIKSFLAGRLAEYKSLNGDLHEKLRRTLHSLEKALRDVNQLSGELRELKENQCRNISEMKAEYTLELAREKEKEMQETAALKDRLEREWGELEHRLRQQVDQQNERANELDKQVRASVDTKYQLDARIAELQNKFVTIEKNLDDKGQECERLRRENRTLDSERHEGAKAVNRHLIRLSALEQEVSDKNDLLTNLTMQLEAQASHRAALEGSWKEAQAAAERAEDRASASATEISKFYQIIEKLQVELRSSKTKVKLKGQVTSQQDSLLNERQSAIEKAQSDNHILRHELANLKVDQDGNKKKAEEMSAKLDEAQDVLRSNQQMIQWLNQQLTEAQLGKLGSTASSRYNTFTPSNTGALGNYSTSTCLTGNRPVDATTPLSSNSSLVGMSTSNAFKNQFPMTAPYLSSSATPFIGVSTIPTKPQQSSIGGLCLTPSLAGSQRSSMYLPVAKTSIQSSTKVQYKPKLGMPSVYVGCNQYPYASGQMPMDNSVLNSWDDCGSWGSKQCITATAAFLYRQLDKGSTHPGGPTNSTTAAAGDSGPVSPTQQLQSPRGRQSPLRPQSPSVSLARPQSPAASVPSGSARYPSPKKAHNPSAPRSPRDAQTCSKGHGRATPRTSPTRLPSQSPTKTRFRL